MPFGLRGFLADLYSAGAAIDFSVLYPSGRLVDAPLPTWTHQRLLVESDGSRARGESTVPVHPLLGAHVRLPEEPERHAWQGEIGTAALPWLADHQVNGVAGLSGGRLLRDGAGVRRRRAGAGLRGARRSLRADADAGRRDFGECGGVGGGRRGRRLRGGDRSRRGAHAASGRGAARVPTTRRHSGGILPPCWPPTRSRRTAPHCGNRSGSAGFSTAPPSPVWCRRAPPKVRAAASWPRSGCPAGCGRSRPATTCILLCWMPASSR